MEFLLFTIDYDIKSGTKFHPLFRSRIDEYKTLTLKLFHKDISPGKLHSMKTRNSSNRTINKVNHKEIPEINVIDVDKYHSKIQPCKINQPNYSRIYPNTINQNHNDNKKHAVTINQNLYNDIMNKRLQNLILSKQIKNNTKSWLIGGR